jgi:hypothetical protein
MDAIDLLARYAGADSGQKFYAPGEVVPIEGWSPRLGPRRSLMPRLGGSSASRTSCAC